ncbi:hypothetical protein [Arthrobacter zhaoguopingii]|uniref:hypothetical protein n=1 Tax=Arthrobacter zhaoguopingii TaxID=2681491 RepID=UPI001357AB96|nr:hypothetical protein [Arthrobacter zhaoguopingii]
MDTEGPDLRTVAGELNNALGPTLVGAIAGNPVPGISTQWQTADGPELDEAEAERITTARAVWQVLVDSEGPDTARLWFIGANPWLEDDSPVTALREGRFEGVLNAAEALVNGSFSG